MNTKMISLYLYATLAFLFSYKSHALSLLEAYEAALENDPSLKVALADFQADKQRAKTATSGLLPNISLSASQEWSKQNTDQISSDMSSNSDTDGDTKQVRLSLRQPVFDASAWFDFKSSRHQIDEAYYRLESERIALLYRVAKAYFEVLRAQDNLALAQKLEASDENQLIETEESVKNTVQTSAKKQNGKQKTQGDIYQALAAYDLSVATRLQFEDTLGQARDALTLIIGSYDTPLLSSTPSCLPPFPSESSRWWIKAAIAKNPELHLSRASVKSFENAHKSAKSAYAPKVYLDINYSDYQSKEDTFSEDNSSSYSKRNSEGASITLTTEIPIYSAGLTTTEVRSSRYQLESAKLSYVNTISELKRRIRASHRTLELGRQRIDMMVKAVESAEKALVSLAQGYEAGIKEINDVLNARRSYYNAIRELTNTQYDYLINRITLKVLAGSLMLEDIRRLSESMKSNENGCNSEIENQVSYLSKSDLQLKINI